MIALPEPVLINAEFDMVEAAHLDCELCVNEARNAAIMAAVTGSRGAVHEIVRDGEVQHAARASRTRCTSTRTDCCCPIHLAAR